MTIQCGICLEPHEEPVAVPCGHIFCSACLAKTFEEHSDTYEVPCPTCRLPFPTISLDQHLIPRKLRAHCTPCLRRVYFDDVDAPLKQVVASLEAQLRAERQRVSDLQHEKEELCKDKTGLYRLVEIYKEREREFDTQDRQQKFQVANQVDDLMHNNQRLQKRLEEAEDLLATMGLDRRTPPASPVKQKPGPGPSTPRSTPRSSAIWPERSIFSSPRTPMSSRPTLQQSISPLKGGLAVARGDLQARLRLSTTPSPSKLKLGDKRPRDSQDDIDMLATSEEEQDDSDDTIVGSNSKRVQRPTGLLGRSVRRKYGIQ
ncbi:hypothetical protein FRC18_005410 [Serendipita sp. 400]|nr:hypothetical protein FRC18_005410 [Serendipita sp. 400]